MTTSRYSRLAFVGVLSVLSATSASAMSCAIDANGKTTCPTSEQVEEFNRTSQPVACTMDAKQCPDGSYVGRVAPDCAFAACPAVDPCAIGVCPNEVERRCAPYICADGTRVPRCATDGTVINYFAEPCLTHGGDAGPFKDVPADHANANAITYVKTEGIVEGYADGTYKPDQTINRAEFVKILLEAMAASYEEEGPPPNPSGACFFHESKPAFQARFGEFPDVDFEAWYASYFCYGMRIGVIEGYPDGTFGPANNVNFAEAAKIISHSFEIAAPGIAAGESWYAPYVRDLERHNAIPLSINSFDQQITRGEMAEMIWRLKAGMTDLPSKTFEELAFELQSSFSSPDFPVRFSYPAAWDGLFTTDNSAPWFIALGPTCSEPECLKISGQHRILLVARDPIMAKQQVPATATVKTLHGNTVYFWRSSSACADFSALVAGNILGEKIAVEIMGSCLGESEKYVQAVHTIAESMTFYKNWP